MCKSLAERNKESHQGALMMPLTEGMCAYGTSPTVGVLGALGDWRMVCVGSRHDPLTGVGKGETNTETGRLRCVWGRLSGPQGGVCVCVCPRV